MELERQDEPTALQSPRAAPFVTASVLLLAASFVLALVGAIRDRESPLAASYDYLLRGDVAFKLGNAADSLHGTARASKLATRSADAARVNYEIAAAMGAPAAIRRLGVLAGEEGKPSASVFAQMLSERVRSQVPAEAARKYPLEVRLWSRIYGRDAIPRRDVGRLSAELRDLNLGPVRHLALASLYDRAGMVAEAATERARLRRSAILGLAALFAVGSFVALLALVGIAALLFYSLRPNVFFAAESAVPEARLSPKLWAAFANFLILLLLVSALPTVVRGLFAGASEESQSQVAFALVGYAVAGAAALALAGRLLARDGLRSVGLRAANLGHEILFGFVGYGASLPLVAAGALAGVAVFGRHWRGVEVHPVIFAIGGAGFWTKLLIFAVVAVAAPVVEETFFRGILLNALRPRFGVTGAVLISSAAFAAIHPQIPTGFLPLFALACVLGVMTAIRGSLAPAMIAHGINNAISFIVAAALLD